MPVTDNNFITAEPDPVVTTNSYAPAAELDASSWKSVSFTIVNIGELDSEGELILDSGGDPIGNTLKWEVFAANASDYSDEVIVKAEASVLLLGIDSYNVLQAPFRYYRIKLKSATGGQEATALIRGIAKA